MPKLSATFSAVIPNYNHSEFILNTLDAALGQTVPFDEIIVIDDASTDDSAALIEARIRDVPRARLIRNPLNMGVIRSSNLGLQEAAGDFICYLSADDDYDRRLVEWCHDLLRQYPEVAMISGNACVHNVTTGTEHRLLLPFAQKMACYSGKNIEAMAKKRAFTFSIGANVIRRDAILAAGQQIQALEWHADWFLYLLIACRYPFGVVPQEFVRVRQVGGQYSNACYDWKKQRPVIEAFIRILRKEHPAEYAFFRRSALLPTYDFSALVLLWREAHLREYLTPLLAWRLLTYKPLRMAGRWMPENLRARAAMAKGVNMKAIIIGANGVIGNALYRALSPACTQCIGLTSQNTPPLVTVSYALSSLQEFIRKSDIVIYCIGISKFAECEAFPEKSLYLNAELPRDILKNLSPRQTFIYLSSPIALYDFKGKKPYNYALHKQCAEDILLHSSHDNCLIIRPSRVIESAAAIKEWKQKLSQGHTITPFFDYFISPIPAAMLSGQILRLIQGGHTGCYNFSARDRISYLEIARELCAHFRLDPALIEKKSAREHNPFFFRQDVLDCTEAGKATGYVPPCSKDIIFDYFQKLA